MDPAALNTLFAGKVVVMPPNEPVIHGRAALIAWAQALGAQFTVNGEYGTLDTTCGTRTRLPLRPLRLRPRRRPQVAATESVYRGIAPWPVIVVQSAAAHAN